MRKIFSILSWFLLLIPFTSCNPDNETGDRYAPAMMSSYPADGATNIAVDIDSIAIQFTEKIMLSSNHQITLNDTRVNASANGRTLIIKNNGLQGSTTYTLSIPENTVSDLAGNFISAMHISFSTAKTNDPVVIDPDPVTAGASTQAVRLYDFLKDNYGVKIISSTMANVNWNINEAEWVKLQTGKYPAIAAFDYVHLMSSPANWIDYSNTTIVENWWNNNGIVSAGWHWNVPVTEGASSYSFRTEETTFNAANATTEGSWENNVVKADLTKIADYLKLLQAKNIPVIWRPLHEAAGNVYEYTGGTAWFWWGASGASAYKKLWIYMFDFFKAQGLNNLIWVWTTQTKDDDYYPGDDYVDIIGRDIYNQTGTTAILNDFNSIQQTYPNKMVTLSELGNTAKITDQWNAGARWSYFMPWYDYERTNNINDTGFSSTEHQYANAAWWIDAAGSEKVITRDEMPDLK